MEGRYNKAIFVPNENVFSDKYISLGRHTNDCLDNLDFCQDGMTLSLWFKAPVPVALWSHLFSSTIALVYFKYETEMQMRMETRYNSTHKQLYLDNMPNVTLDQWHLLSYTYKQSDVKIYFDGCRVDPISKLKYENKTVRDFNLGSTSGRSSANINYDELRVWNVVKSPRFMYWLWKKPE